MRYLVRPHENPLVPYGRLCLPWGLQDGSVIEIKSRSGATHRAQMRVFSEGDNHELVVYSYGRSKKFWQDIVHFRPS